MWRRVRVFYFNTIFIRMTPPGEFCLCAQVTSTWSVAVGVAKGLLTGQPL